MKKLVCLLLAVLLVLGACACAAKDQTTASDTTDQPRRNRLTLPTMQTKLRLPMLTRSANTTPRLKLPQP